MSTLSSFSYLSCCYLYLLVLSALFHLCISNQNHDGVFCMDGERQALLEFKHGLVDETDRLASWFGDKSDCCRWKGIACDNSTGRVHRIHLPALNGNCHMDYRNDKEYREAVNQRLRGSLSSSLTQSKQLRHLDLSCNDFGKIQVPEFIASLGNLRYLNLSSSNFSGIIPPQIGNLSNLHVLYLGSFYKPYELTSMMNMNWLTSLRKLHHLDMSGVALRKATDWLQVINTLPSLVQLHLSNCYLLDINRQLPSFNITSLSLLDLSKNYFNSLVPCWIFSITSLVSLDLSSCNFHGDHPNSVGFHNLTSLKFLHVRDNDFMNSSLVLEGLSSTVGSNLISLDISFCGVSSAALNALHNLTSLISLDVSHNQLTKAIPKSLGNFCNLKDIDLSDNNFLNINLRNLRESFFECKSSKLESLTLRSSGASGHIPDEVLVHLLLDFNYITGIITPSIGELSSLRTLSLIGNMISGPIPYSIGRLSSLEVLGI